MPDFNLEALRARQAAARAETAAAASPGDDRPPHLDPDAIASCGLCDDDGYRGLAVCDHIEHYADTVTGRAAVTAALAKIRNRHQGETA